MSEQKIVMPYRLLGATGLKVSVLSYGTWATFSVKSEETAAKECLQIAYDNGVNFFDCAEAYGKNTGDAEIWLGKFLKEKNWERNSLVISTKLFWGGAGVNDKGLSRKHLLEGMDRSLKRLQLDYVDLIFAHRPDAITPMEEIVRAFSHIVNSGKALYWGTSEWSAQQITEAHWIARMYNLVPPSMEQPEYNMFNRERMEKEYVRMFKAPYGIGTTIWSPLNSGILTGKYNESIPADSRLAMNEYQFLTTKFNKVKDDRIPKIKQLQQLATELGCSLPALAIAWTVVNPNVSTCILGASKPSQLTENLKALEVVPKLTPQILTKIDEILGNKPEQPLTFGRE